jgi:hypothetical protein
VATPVTRGSAFSTTAKHSSSTAARQLLYTRQQTAALLGGISLSTILRLERDHALKKIRLMRGKSAHVFHSAENVNALVAARIAQSERADDE